MRNAIIVLLLMVCSTAWCKDNIRTVPSAYTFKDIYDSSYMKLDQTTPQTITLAEGTTVAFGYVDVLGTKYPTINGTAQFLFSDSLIIAGTYPAIVFADTAGLHLGVFVYYGSEGEIESSATLKCPELYQTRSGTITRDANGYIETVARTGGKTYTVTRGADNYISSFTDGTLTWAVTRDANDRISEWSVS